MSGVLEARALGVRRGRRLVVESVDLRLDAGAAVALIGPNAAGKSTLLRALCRLLPAAFGEVRLLDKALPAWPRGALARTLALVSADEQGADSLTVEDRVALGRYPHAGPFRPLGDADHAAIERALQQAGITELRTRQLGTLSAGERQLTTLARGLAQEPRVLLLDEPGAHLDVGHELDLFRVLDEVRAGGVAVLAVVHDLARAARWAEHVVLLDGGRVKAAGSPEEVLQGPACAAAFGVQVRAHRLPGSTRSLFEFHRA